MKKWNRLFLVFAIFGIIAWFLTIAYNSSNNLPVLDFASIWDVAIFCLAFFFAIGWGVTDNLIVNRMQKEDNLREFIEIGYNFECISSVAKSFNHKLTLKELRDLYKVYSCSNESKEIEAVFELTEKLYGCIEAGKLARS